MNALTKSRFQTPVIPLNSKAQLSTEEKSIRLKKLQLKNNLLTDLLKEFDLEAL